MGTDTKPTDNVGVVLLRPGVGRQDYALAPGSTVADLLRAAHASLENQAIFIDGRSLAESLRLQPGMVISVVPRVRNAADSWRDMMDQPDVRRALEEVMQAVNEERESEKDRS